MDFSTVADMFPAHAGMIRFVSSLNIAHYNVPRTRGDDPDTYQYTFTSEECSPHTRG